MKRKELINIVLVYSFCAVMNIRRPLLLTLISVDGLGGSASIQEITSLNYSTYKNILFYLREFERKGYFVRNEKLKYSITASGQRIINKFLLYCNNR